MGDAGRGEAVVITGLFGVGKSTVAAELAERLEQASVPYAAIDLDWLTWSNLGGGGRDAAHGNMLRNLDGVLANYRALGLRYLVLAHSIADSEELADLAATVGMRLRSVELVVRLDVVELRLRSDPTTGREGDLAESRRWQEAGLGGGFADLTVINEGSVAALATEILRWLGWPDRPAGDDRGAGASP